MKICIIAAVAANGAIGVEGRLPWNIPEDLHRFKRLTMGHAVVMGRKTFDSLPHGPLPGRRNIVVSRTMEKREDCTVVRSLQMAIAACKDCEKVWIIGGEQIYKAALPIAHELHLTLVDESPEKADAFFPTIDMSRWIETKKEKHQGFSFCEYGLR